MYCWDLVENLGIHIHQGYRSEILLFVGVFAWFGDQGNSGFIKSSLPGQILLAALVAPWCREKPELL